MAKPYALEMSKLSQTFGWAGTTDISVLSKALRLAGLAPLISVGSGGSLTAGHAQAYLHQSLTGHTARVSTPLEIASGAIDCRAAVWLLSAGGGNVDIQAAFKAAAIAEPRQLAVLCGKSKSALVELAQHHRFTDTVLHEPPAGKDGFLATNSLLGFVTLLTRAYLQEFGGGAEQWEAIFAAVSPLLSPANKILAETKKKATALWKLNTTLVLYGPTSNIGAVDMESKFTEAAIGNLQIADYRNFAHGRHHWLAKHAASSGVLAFVSPNDETLAEKTLAHIPKNIPQVRVSLDGPAEASQIASLVWALYITGWAGEARGIDPGQPGVPEFGRKLYHLALPKPPKSASTKKLRLEDEVAVVRKTGERIQSIVARGSLVRWMEALNAFRKKLYETKFGGVVLDYDGTVVETRDRFSKPAAEMANALERLLKAGIPLAIATGRGASVRRDLQAVLNRKYWDAVLIGYYNGAEIASLADDAAPDGTDKCCDNLRSLADALKKHPELAEIAEQTDRKYQITIQAKHPVPENRLWDLVHQVILTVDAKGHTVTRSSHSIDVVSNGVSKKNVISALQEQVGSKALLTIGDRGRWPGNDYELLREPFSLSVDEVSVDPLTCWNLGNPGQRGPATTALYLNSLQPQRKLLQFTARSIG